MTTTTKRKTVSHAKPKPAIKPPEVISEIHLIPLERIKIEAQVRTEFNEDSIRELAADIEARGLRQPVEVTPIGDELYKLTIGERRYRAIKLLGQKAVPAIIVKTSDADRLVDQLAENIQREDLTMAEEIAAVRDLFDKLGSTEAVAARIHKPKPWVSKRLAASIEKIGMRTKNLIEDGFTEDIELVNTLSQIEKAYGYDYNGNFAFFRKIESEGGITREEAREHLRNMKAEAKKAQEANAGREAKKAKADAKKKEREEAAYKLKTEGTGPEFLSWAMQEIVWRRHDRREFVNMLSEEQANALQDHLVKMSNHEDSLMEIAGCLVSKHATVPTLALLAMFMKFAGMEITLDSVTHILEKVQAS
jgi:ParB/RepB/Spo0J family partition protein